MKGVNSVTLERGSIVVLGRPLDYFVRRSQRKTLEFRLTEDGALEVRAPNELPFERIEERLRARSKWMARRLVELENARPRLVARTYQAGESHRYLGRQYRLALNEGAATSVRADSGRLRVTVYDPMNSKVVKTAVDAWYSARAKAILPARLERLLALPTLHRARPNSVRIQRLRKRWGSCSPHGTVLLNTDLVRLPTSLIDFVLVHELCHLRVPHHDARFERLMSRVMPDWRSLHAKLVEYRLD